MDDPLPSSGPFLSSSNVAMLKQIKFVVTADAGCMHILKIEIYGVMTKLMQHRAHCNLGHV